MKTIYSANGKYVLDDKIFSKTERAIQRVGQLLKEEEWVPSIESYVPNTRYISSFEERPGMNPTGQVVIKIKPDSDVDDSASQNITRSLAGQFPTREIGEIKVDIGEYNQGGWESLIDHEGLLNPLDTYFTLLFINDIINSSSITDLPNLKEVESEHWRPLAKKIFEYIEGNWKYTPVPEHDARDKKLHSATKSYLDGETSLEDMIRILQEFP